MAVHFERGEELEHLLDLLDVGLLIDGGVRRHLVAKDLRHADRLDALLEHPFALDDQVVRIFQAVNVDVPVQPLGRLDGGTAIVFAFADGFGVLVGNQLLSQQTGEGRFYRGE